MNDNRHLPRRKVLGMAVASGLTLLTAPLRSIAQQVTRRTPAQILGPYYPVIKPTDQDMDLTMIAGRPGRAQGQVIYVSGVINRHSKPVAGAQMEIWRRTRAAVTRIRATSTTRHWIPTSRAMRSSLRTPTGATGSRR
jgi:protocatechuate 3,4-dioxygenase beta subunit